MVAPPVQNLVLGIGLKLVAVIFFAGMATVIKLLTDRYPVGQITFCRSFFALIPVFVWVGWRGEFPTVFQTPSLKAHFMRLFAGASSMFLGFAALGYLPIADATAIGYVSPLITVALAVLLLGETVRLYRWTAVALGLVGVLIILSDYVGPGGGGPERSALGAAMQLGAASFGALAAVQIRKLTRTDGAATIVVYFSAFTAAISLVTLPFGWVVPDATDAALLVGTGILGGLGQVLMTQSFRYADASVLAPFDYTSMIWALAASLVVFGTWPTGTMLAGTAVVIAAGLLVIFRERQLGIRRDRSKPAQPPPAPLT